MDNYRNGDQTFLMSVMSGPCYSCPKPKLNPVFQFSRWWSFGAAPFLGDRQVRGNKRQAKKDGAHDVSYRMGV